MGKLAPPPNLMAIIQFYGPHCLKLKLMMMIMMMIILSNLVRLATTLLKDEETARDNHLLACNFDKYSELWPRVCGIVFLAQSVRFISQKWPATFQL